MKNLNEIKIQFKEILDNISWNNENRYEVINLLTDIKSMISNKQSDLEEDFFIIEKVEDNLIIIYANSYHNPGEQFNRIEEQLKDFNGTVIMDCLLSNGTGNRLFEIKIDENNRKLRRNFKHLSEEFEQKLKEKGYLVDFYKNHLELFENNHVLSQSEKLEILDELNFNNLNDSEEQQVFDSYKNINIIQKDTLIDCFEKINKGNKMDKYIYNIDKIPNSYKDYYNNNQDKFNSKIDLELEDEYMDFINEMTKENKVDLNLYMNYVFMKLIISEKMKEETSYSLGISCFDFELYTEEEFSELIENNTILIFDEKANKKAVIIPQEEYEKLKKYDNLTFNPYKNINIEDEDLMYYEMLLENLEKIQS